MKLVQPINTLKEYQELSQSKNSIFIIELYAPWCTRCKNLENVLMKQQLGCDIYKLDIDAEPFIDEEEFGSITALPSLWVYKKGKKHQLNNPNLDLIKNTLNSC